MFPPTAPCNPSGKSHELGRALAVQGPGKRLAKPGRKPISPGSVRLVLDKRARAAGMVGSKLEPISPHGLRVGFITTAYGNGVADERIMEHTRQKNLNARLRPSRPA